MRITSIVLALGVLGGCATRPAADPSVDPSLGSSPVATEAEVQAASERLTLSVRGQAWRDVLVDGARLHGAGHELSHFDDGYRGSSPRGFLFLSEPEPGTVSGVIGNGAITRVDYLVESSGHIHAQGRWASKKFGLEIDKDTIAVSSRFCTDTYRRIDESSDVFSGSPSCWQAGRAGAQLQVPDTFFARPPGEQVVFLSAFLL